MEFEHPIFLAGLAAAFIPLLVHLFDRRKARPLPFAAIEFVLRSRKRTASRLKLRPNISGSKAASILASTGSTQ